MIRPPQIPLSIPCKTRKLQADGVPAKILKLVIEVITRTLLSMFIACLAESSLLLFLKGGLLLSLFLIPERKNNPGTPSSFRLMCMLDTTGKCCGIFFEDFVSDSKVSEGDLPPQFCGETIRSTHVPERAGSHSDHSHCVSHLTVFPRPLVDAWDQSRSASTQTPSSPAT